MIVISAGPLELQPAEKLDSIKKIFLPSPANLNIKKKKIATFIPTNFILNDKSILIILCFAVDYFDGKWNSALGQLGERQRICADLLSALMTIIIIINIIIITLIVSTLWLP